MISRSFYSFAETVDRLAIDQETMRQMLLKGRLFAYLEFSEEFALWTLEEDWIGENKLESERLGECPIRVCDEHSRWHRVKDVFHDDGDGGMTYLDGWSLTGWLHLGFQATADAALAKRFDSPYDVAPSWVDGVVVLEPYEELWFRCFGSSRSLESAWFMASDIDALVGNVEPDSRGKWPWGDHDTELLQHLAAAGERWGSKFYDPDDPRGTAPTNPQIVKLLVDRGVKPRMAKAMATILRKDGLETGRRPGK